MCKLHICLSECIDKLFPETMTHLDSDRVNGEMAVLVKDCIFPAAVDLYYRA
jgi:hypothetical protein